MGYDFYLCRAINRSELKKKKELNKYGQVILPLSSGQTLLPNTYSFDCFFLEDLIGYKNMIEFVHDHLDCVADAIEPIFNMNYLLTSHSVKIDKKAKAHDIKEILYFIDDQQVSEDECIDFKFNCRNNIDGLSMKDINRARQKVFLKNYNNDDNVLAEFDMTGDDEFWYYEEYNLDHPRKIFCYESLKWLGGKSTVDEWPHYVTDKYKPNGFCDYRDYAGNIGCFITTMEDLKEFQKNARKGSRLLEIKELKPNEFISIL